MKQSNLPQKKKKNILELWTWHHTWILKKWQEKSENDLCSIKTKTQALLRWVFYSILCKRKLWIGMENVFLEINRHDKVIECLFCGQIEILYKINAMQ